MHVGTQLRCAAAGPPVYSSDCQQKDAFNSYLTWNTSSLPWTAQRELFQSSPAPNPCALPRHSLASDPLKTAPFTGHRRSADVAWTCRFIAYGAVVGGPSSLNATAFPDTRRAFQYTEPALDYGGGLIGALAVLVTYYADQHPASMCNLNLGFQTPGAPALRVAGCAQNASLVQGR